LSLLSVVVEEVEDDAELLETETARLASWEARALQWLPLGEGEGREGKTSSVSAVSLLSSSVCPMLSASLPRGVWSAACASAISAASGSSASAAREDDMAGKKGEEARRERERARNEKRGEAQKNDKACLFVRNAAVDRK
jgi:type IV secretory pathway TrbL component